MKIEVRPARESDIDRIAHLGEEFADFLRALGDPSPTSLDPAAIRRDGFGPSPAFSAIVAQLEDRVDGYLLYHPGYDIERGGAVLCVIDLYVHEGSRRRGLGRAMMNAAARVARDSGARALVWSVYDINNSAFRFYEHIGAQYEMDLRSMYWQVHTSEETPGAA
jgi:diamine N-acetyltransferase